MRIKGSRTIIVASGLSVLPLLDVISMLNALPEFQAVLQQYLPEKYKSFYALFMAIVMMYMRMITTGPMEKPAWKGNADQD